MKPIKTLLNEKLTRPDWINISPRDAAFLWLDKNENLDSAYIDFIKKEVIAKNVGSIDLSTYPELGLLYNDLAVMEGVNPQQLLLTTGSDGAIRTVFQSFVEQGSKVFISNPSFAMYDIYCKIFGADTRYIDYKRDNGIVSLDVDSLVKQIRSESPVLVCLPNPDSPTGTVLPEKDLLNIYQACKDVDAVFFVDEAYYPFHDFTMANHINETKGENLIICRTFSKAWGMAGVRVGHLISHRNTIALMNKIRPMYEIGALAMKIAHAVISYHDKMRESVAVIKKGKNYFEYCMRDLGFETLESHGNFSHVALAGHKEAIFKKLDTFVYYRKDFPHPSLQGFTRFSAAPKAVMEKVVDAIKNTIK